MYVLKPMITYYEQLFKQTRKIYSEATALSSNFAVPELPQVYHSTHGHLNVILTMNQTAPTFSTEAPVRVRPPTSLSPETQQKAEVLRNAKKVGLRRSMLLHLFTYAFFRCKAATSYAARGREDLISRCDNDSI